MGVRLIGDCYRCNRNSDLTRWRKDGEGIGYNLCLRCSPDGAQIVRRLASETPASIALKIFAAPFLVALAPFALIALLCYLVGCVGWACAVFFLHLPGND
jgi:hypothetical protein